MSLKVISGQGPEQGALAIRGLLPAEARTGVSKSWAASVISQERSFRPSEQFCVERDGFVLREGSGEDLEHAGKNHGLEKWML